MKFYPIREYFVFLEALSLLHFSKLLILSIPFKKIAARLGKLNVESSHMAQARNKWLPVEIGILRASRFTIHQSKCYDQALTAKLMLRRRGLSSTLYFGLSKADAELNAHAWVRSGDRIITGRGSMQAYTPVAWFGDNL
jgi:hypothetical protein